MHGTTHGPEERKFFANGILLLSNLTPQVRLVTSCIPTLKECFVPGSWTLGNGRWTDDHIDKMTESTVAGCDRIRKAILSILQESGVLSQRPSRRGPLRSPLLERLPEIIKPISR